MTEEVLNNHSSGGTVTIFQETERDNRTDARKREDLVLALLADFNGFSWLEAAKLRKVLPYFLMNLHGLGIDNPGFRTAEDTVCRELDEAIERLQSQGYVKVREASRGHIDLDLPIPHVLKRKLAQIPSYDLIAFAARITKVIYEHGRFQAFGRIPAPVPPLSP